MSGRDDTPRQVAVLGLGSMGGAMAGWLAHNGWQVRGHDPDPAAREAAESAGVGCVADPTELAGTPYVVLSLPSAAVVAEVLPLLVTADTRAVVDTTTSDPGTARGMAEVCGRHGAAFVDAPVSGGPRRSGVGWPHRLRRW